MLNVRDIDWNRVYPYRSPSDDTTERTDNYPNDTVDDTTERTVNDIDKAGGVIWHTVNYPTSTLENTEHSAIYNADGSVTYSN